MNTIFITVLLTACIFLGVRADCECGYLDPLTNALWTDRTITYFNESALSDVVTQPATSPRIYGGATPGDTGDGQQAWSLVGDLINKWEYSFDATYRSAVSYNNTYFDTDDNSLALEVSPANLEHRIVNGSQIVTRRRDILYGSFRAQIQPAVSLGKGAAFEFGAYYNDSESVNLGFYTSDDPNNSTLQWSWAAYDHSDDPVATNISSLGTADFLEHRFDWNSTVLQWRNAAANDSANFYAIQQGVNASYVPSMPAPISFRAWANGEDSQSQGPPLVNPLTTHVRYTRFFFNSSLEDRQAQFESQCLAAGDNAVCSTEDFTLRNSTEFDLSALAKQLPPPNHFTAPLYAVIVISAAAGIFVMTIAHGLVVRRIKAQYKERTARIAAQQIHGNLDSDAPPESPVDGADLVDDKTHFIGRVADSPDTPSPSSSKQPTPFALWASPDLVYDSDSDDSTDNEDETRSNSSMAEHAASVLPRYGSSTDHKRRLSQVQHGFQSPTPTSGADTPKWIEEMNKEYSLPYIAPGFAPTSSRPASVMSLSSHGHNVAASKDADDEIEMIDESAPHSRRFSSYSEDKKVMSRPQSGSMWEYQHEGTSRPASLYAEYGAEVHDAFQRPQIIQWQQRDLNDADGAVGALARPELGDSVGRKARDGAGAGVKPPESLFQVLLRRGKDVLFIKGSTQLTSTGARRIDYLDGMRGFACFLVSFHHFMLIYYFGITTPDSPHHYPRFEFWFRSLIGPLVVNQGLKLGIFFMLPSRTMVNRYLLKGGLQGMGDITVRRVPRLALPTMGAVLANYFFMDIGAFKWVPRLASRTWSTWSYWQPFDNVMVFFDACISLWWSSPPVSPALVTGYATGVLWTIPVIVQGTWTCLICALVAHEIKNPYKRYSFYALCVSLSWYANTWDLFFMAGIIVADLDSKLNYQAKAAKGFPIIPTFVCKALHLPDRARNLRIHGQVFAWALFLAAWTQQYLSQIPTSSGRGFDNWEHELHPNWLTSEPHAWTQDAGVSYTDPRVSAWVLSFSFFLLTDLNNLLRAFFRLRLWSYIGRHAFAVFLMHGVIWWTWSAWLCLALLTAGVPYWATILVVFVTSYALLFVVAECFTRTFDSWGGTISKAVWRATSGGLGRK